MLYRLKTKRVYLKLYNIINISLNVWRCNTGEELRKRAQTDGHIKPAAVTCTATSGSAGKTLVKFVNGDASTRWAEQNRLSENKPSEYS